MAGVIVPETRKLLLSVSDKTTMDEDIWQWLFKHGVAIVRANSTRKALELLGRAQYDAVLSNLRRKEDGVPNPDAGIELAAQVRRINPYLPVIIYTFNPARAKVQAAMDCGASLVTVNPIELKKYFQSLGF